MVLDTSALTAILQREPSADRLMQAISVATVRVVSAATVLELSLVLLGRYGELGEAQLDAFLRALRVEVVPVDAEQLALARDAARVFGRGRHPAGLNFVDCFSYALAIQRGEPLLFVGLDFGRTDVIAAEW
ncbi:MAG: type II toxin-antitoxin system VapC family toxin [Gemmatimonadaceae bacterium]|jgi:ribonuclease VapC|nr:type II toxin-antitoxin system VapC family toxin [Gemmatimonadaceae bacterium]